MDMGNLRASEYKFNKFIHLPKPKKASKESMNEVRRNEMSKVFDRVKKKIETQGPQKGMNGMVKGKNKVVNVTKGSNSNLSEDERAGLNSLKKRVKSGELVITETDKSKRFCLLTRRQYELAGLKHTEKDEEITPDQLTKVQKVVNEHCDWVSKIFNVGENWNQMDRVHSSM